MRNVIRLACLFAVTIVLGPSARSEDPPKPATRNVVLVTTDGLRWQEVFRGAEESLMTKDPGGVSDPDSLRRDFWRPTPEARREALMPFFWKTIARQGQVYGNQDKRSVAHVTNGKNFSYPGYNELLTGRPDPRVDSNDKVDNPNVSVLEWLNLKAPYRGQVSTVGSWDLYPYILNVGRSGLKINAGWAPIDGAKLTETQALLNRLSARAVREWPECRNDPMTFEIALEYLRRDTPRVFYIAFGDTDEYAHRGRYDNYLQSAHDFDASLKTLWDELQKHPKYRGTTSLVVTTDHGRGDPPTGWRNHGEKVAGSEAIWIAVLGPDTPALGERSDVKPVTQSQVAATVAALLGENYAAEVSQVAPPVHDAVRPGAGTSATATAPAPAR